MFALFGALMMLVTFLVVNVLVSLLVMAMATKVMDAVRPARARTRARVLLGLRLLPASAAAVVAAGLVVPAYLLFEPADAGERPSAALWLLAAAAIALGVDGLVRGARAVAATRALEHRWKRDAEPLDLTPSPVPAYRVRGASPVFAVVGLYRSRLYVSAPILDSLTPAELAAAVAHERAHLARRDNLERLLIRSCPDLLGALGSESSRAIEREWAQAAEAAADERAAEAGPETALALAASLVKVARLAPEPAGWPVSTLHGGGVDVRVRRLVEIGSGKRKAGGPGARGPFGAGEVLAAMAGVVVVLTATPALARAVFPTVHLLVEAAARLLR